MLLGIGSLRYANQFLQEKGRIPSGKVVWGKTNGLLDNQTSRVPEAKVPMLALLSDHLRDELRYEVQFTCIMQNVLFTRLIDLSKHVVFTLCNTAMSQRLFATSEMVFVPRCEASHVDTPSFDRC